MRSSRALAAAVASLLVARPLLGAPASADLVAARALFHHAEIDEQAGRWAEALGKLRRASSVKMTPGLLFHIALCEERLGHLLAALSDYTASQATARVENNMEVLGLVSEPILAVKIRIPTLTIELPPAFAAPTSGTEVRLDGVVLALASVGAPLPIDVGSHTVQARAPGQAPYSATLTLVERQAQAIHVQFVPLPIEPTPAAAPLAHAETEPQGSRTLAIAATGAAVLLVVAGVGAYVAAGSDQSYWQGACEGKGPGCGNGTAVRAWDATALTAWIVGAGAGALAVVLWTRPGGGGATRAELRPGAGALSLSGTF